MPVDNKYKQREKETPMEVEKYKNCCCDKNNIPDGVYFYTKKGNCWKIEDFYKCTEEIKGIAIIKEEQRIVVHPRSSNKDILLLDISKSIPEEEDEEEGYCEIYNRSMKHHDGYNATEKLHTLGSPAAKYCKLIGKEWYLPTLAEMVLMYDHKEELNEFLSKIGETIDSGWHWTSTKFTRGSHWVLDWSTGNSYDCFHRYSNRIRSISAFV